MFYPWEGHSTEQRQNKRRKIDRDTQTHELEEHGINSNKYQNPESKSNILWQAPVLMVKKKSGDYRFAVDFVNTVIRNWINDTQ